MFFDSRKEKKKEKEKEGGTASVRREVIRTNNTDENYRAITELGAFPGLTRINGQKGRINWFNGQKGRKKAYMLRSNNFI